MSKPVRISSKHCLRGGCERSGAVDDARFPLFLDDVDFEVEERWDDASGRERALHGGVVLRSIIDQGDGPTPRSDLAARCTVLRGTVLEGL